MPSLRRRSCNRFPLPVRQGRGPTAARPPTPCRSLRPKSCVKRIKPQHPRLLLDAAGFDGLRKKIAADPPLWKWEQDLPRQANHCLKEKPPEHVMPDGLRLLDTSRRMVQHSYTLALAYRLHGDRRYLDHLWNDMETVAKFPDFNPRHFLDTAEMTHAGPSPMTGSTTGGRRGSGKRSARPSSAWGCGPA